MSMPPPPPPPQAVLTPATNSRLEALISQYDAKKKAAAEANKEFDDLKVAIKFELAQAVPHSRDTRVTSNYLDQPLRMVAREKWVLDSKSLKAAEPALWVKHAEKKTAWYLESVK